MLKITRLALAAVFGDGALPKVCWTWLLVAQAASAHMLIACGGAPSYDDWTTDSLVFISMIGLLLLVAMAIVPLIWGVVELIIASKSNDRVAVLSTCSALACLTTGAGMAYIRSTLKVHQFSASVGWAALVGYFLFDLMLVMIVSKFSGTTETLKGMNG